MSLPEQSALIPYKISTFPLGTPFKKSSLTAHLQLSPDKATYFLFDSEFSDHHIFPNNLTSEWAPQGVKTDIAHNSDLSTYYVSNLWPNIKPTIQPTNPPPAIWDGLTDEGHIKSSPPWHEEPQNPQPHAINKIFESQPIKSLDEINSYLANGAPIQFQNNWGNIWDKQDEDFGVGLLNNQIEKLNKMAKKELPDTHEERQIRELLNGLEESYEETMTAIQNLSDYLLALHNILPAIVPNPINISHMTMLETANSLLKLKKAL